MMRRFLATWLLAIFVPLLAFAAEEPGVKVLLPFDLAVVRSSSILLLFQTPSDSPAKLSLDRVTVPPAKVVPGDKLDLYHMRLALREGINELVWTDPATEKELARMELVYIPPESMKRVPDMDARRFVFHTREQEARCNSCHALPEPTEMVDDERGEAVAKVCTACHKTIGKEAFVHKPAGERACFRCHEPRYLPSRFRIVNSMPTQCGLCHENFTERVLGEALFVHGPVAGGACMVCHDPHGGETSGLLREPVIATCLRCHTTIDFQREGALHGELTCDKCHEPHGSDNPMLTSAGGNALCAACHDLQMGNPGHPIENHPVEGPVDPTMPGRPMGCLSCHAVHGEVDISQSGVMEDEVQRKTFCDRCHY